MMSRLAVTTSLKIIVFDTERTDAEALATHLQAIQLPLHQEVTPVWRVTDLGPTLAAGVDLLFMGLHDTEHPYDGVDLVLKLVPQDSRTRVIFVGGGSEARRRVYLADHLWHLLKPVDHIELAEAMERAVEILNRDRGRAIVLRAGHTDTVIAPRDIIYVESNLRVLSVHEHGRIVKTYGNLTDIASLLPSNFVRCHKSYLVNLEHVLEMGKRSLQLDSSEEVPVSQRRYMATHEALYAHFRSLRI